MAEYDPMSEVESPELLGLINGQSGEPLFVHICKQGFSAVLYSNCNRTNCTVGDFVIVRVKRNPPAIAENHRSKHRVTSVRKVQCPDSVKAVKQILKKVTLTLVARPLRLTQDALLLADDQLGIIVDKDGKVPIACLKQNCSVLIDAIVVLSPKDRTSSIFIVTNFIKYVEERLQEPNPKDQPLRPTHIGCIVDYKEPYCWVWCRGFDSVLRLDPTILSERVTYGSWISFGAPSYYEDYVSIEQAAVIKDKFDTRVHHQEFEINVLCERFKKDDKGTDLYLAKELNQEVFDTQNIVSDVNPEFPCPLWITPRLSPTGVVRWEFSAGNEPEPVNLSGEKAGLITNGSEFEYFVFCPFYDSDIMIHKEKLNNPDAIGKWISFEEVKSGNGGRLFIPGEVKIIAEVVPTRIRHNIPEILISCSSLQRRNPAIFYSDEVAGDVLDIHGLVENPDTVSLPFSAWAVKHKRCEFGCRWKISSQNGSVNTSGNSLKGLSSETHKLDEVPQPSLQRAHPSQSEILNLMYKKIHGGGMYSDDEEDEEKDEESQASTVSSAAGELAKLGMRDDSPIQEDSRENVTQPTLPNYAGKTGQELVSILLDNAECSNFINSQDPTLHAALLNFVFSGDAPLPK